MNCSPPPALLVFLPLFHRWANVGISSFLCEDFFERLGLAPEHILGRPLASIVDPRDVYALTNAVSQVLGQGGGGGPLPNGILVNLRVACGGRSYEASMTITIGSEGIIVVTRLY